MLVPLCLNDLSCENWPESIHERVGLIVQLAVVLTEVKKLRRRSYLLAGSRIGELAVGGVSLASFMSEGSARDALRTLLSFSNVSPYESYEEVESDGFECFADGISARGLLFASLLRTTAVSFPSATKWLSPTIEVVIEELLDVEGEPTICNSPRIIANLSSADHLSQHAGDISGFGIDSIASAAGIWAGREDLFPGLRFLPDVQFQLERSCVDDLARRQICHRLRELEMAVGEWDPVSQRFPAWYSKVTPEGQQRRHLCEFPDECGVKRLYDLHARFTPGAGRIHFRLIPDLRMLEIAYIGSKLQ